MTLDHDNLEEFDDPISYDEENEQPHPSDAFYPELAQQTSGPILDMACGTGSMAIALARQGFEVTGIDIMPTMLEAARRKGAGLPIRWVQADCRAFQLEQQFRLIFMTGNAFQSFITREDQEALLARVREHLHPEGIFAFETRNPRLAQLSRPNTEEQLWKNYTDRRGFDVRVTEMNYYDHVTQIQYYTLFRRWVEGGREVTRISRIALRYVFPQEMDALLHYNGFTILHRYGYWDRSPLSESSPSMIYVLRNRKT